MHAWGNMHAQVGHAWPGVWGCECLARGGIYAWGGMCGWGHAYPEGACMAGSCAYLGACLARGVCGQRGVHAQGACMAGGCACPGACMPGGACVARVCVCPGHLHAMHTPLPDNMRYGWSMRGRYAFYWDAFLFLVICNIFTDCNLTARSVCILLECLLVFIVLN